MSAAAREPNAIDFWRGVALVTIFINHIPGLWWEWVTHRNFSFSDSAELFVFLAGWSLRRIAGGPTSRPLHIVLRLFGRAVTIYGTQVFLSTLAVALIAAAAYFLENPLLLEWNNTAPVFTDPVPTHVGLVLLTHQLGYFDILPLYVVLMLAAPVMVLIDRFSPPLLLVLSFGTYAAALATGFNLPTWPVQGVWYFNPLAWQLVFVLGFTLARDAAPDKPLGRAVPPLRWLAWPAVILTVVVIRMDALPDPMLVPEPTLLFIVDKTYLTPLRLLQFFALAIAAAPLYGPIVRAAPAFVRFFAALGRNSLKVFCVGSLASLVGQIARFMLGSGFVVDTALVLLGIMALRFTAWGAEWRERARLERAGS